MNEAKIRARLDEQDWACVYAHCLHEGTIKPGDQLAFAYDGHGLAHLSCAGGSLVAPSKTVPKAVAEPEGNGLVGPIDGARVQEIWPGRLCDSCRYYQAPEPALATHKRDDDHGGSRMYCDLHLDEDGTTRFTDLGERRPDGTLRPAHERWPNGSPT